MTQRAWVDNLLQRYDQVDTMLVSAGFPATSAWWRAQLERFLRTGSRRWLLRVGRRGGKSSTLARLAVAWALYGSWLVPLGDVAVVAFVSIDRDARGMNDDHVASAVMMPAIADALNLLPHSPTAPRSRRDMTSIRRFLSDG